MLITETLRKKYDFVDNVYEVYDYENLIDKDFLEYCLTTDQNQDGVCIKIKDGKYYKLTIVDDEFVIVEIMNLNAILISGEKINGRKTITANYPTMITKLSINNQGLSFIKYRRNESFVPLGIKNLKFLKTYDFIDELMKIYFEYIINMNSFFKEFFEEYRQGNNVILPISFNEIFNYHNKKNMFINMYKGASRININYNKRSINNSYSLIKLVNYIDEKSLKMLINLKDFTFYDYNNDYNRYSSSETIQSIQKTLCVEFYKDKLNLYDVYDCWEEDEFVTVIRDYIDMARRLKLKVNLMLSQKGLINEHNKLVKMITNKNTKTINIPKNSKFNILNERLPRQFERITTRKRLILEGELQCHCVATYDDLINNDDCAIYSYLLNDERVTIEIRKKYNKFYIRQARKKFNASISNEDKEMIESFLNKIMIKKVEILG